MKNPYKVNEEAVKKIAERIYDNGSTVINRNDLEEIFPELKESEDERIRNGILHLVQCAPEIEWCKSNVSIGEVQTWLEEKLKDEQKAWSEGDEKMLDEIIDFFKNGTVKLQHDLSLYASWLKSLKDRVQQQSKWKPSDEQTYWLKWATGRMPDTEKANEAEAVLEELLEDLKKLREE